MARRKIAFVFLLLALMALILSPWASAPSPSVPAVPEDTGTSAQAAAPVKEDKPVALRVAVALDDEEFDHLQKQNEAQAFRFPDIRVEWVQVAPGEAYMAMRNASRLGEAADVMLMENEWVMAFAASGYLMPADSAYVGEAMSEQFEAVAAPLKWNGYLWAVPRDFDPYVLIWNDNVLRALLGEQAVTPQNAAQWTELAVKSREAGGSVRWLAIDASDPYALLSWVGAAAAQRTDTIWSENGNPWSGTPKGEALGLLDRERAGVAYESDARQIASWVASGKSAAAVLPYSQAQKLLAAFPDSNGVRLTMDRSAWKLPHTWPRGRSFAISSRTKAEDAARRWIAAITETFVQQDNLDTFGKLPVYRSIYRSSGKLSSLFSGSESGVFPYQPPEETGPELPARMSLVGRLWSEWAAGRLGLEQWIRRWPETSADFELND